MPSNNVDEWDEFYRTQSVAVQPDLFVVRRFSREPTHPTRRVLILAAGAGRNAIWLAKRGFYVMAVDQSSEALEKLKWWAKTEGLEDRVDTLQLDLLAGREAYEKYLETHDYDFIILEGCLEYFEDADVNRVLGHLRGSMRAMGTRVFIFARDPSHWAHTTAKRSDGWMKTIPRDDFWYAMVLNATLSFEHFESTLYAVGTSKFQGLTKEECHTWSNDFFLEGWK